MPRKIKYIWYGFPAHFIMRERCLFHLTTAIGKNIVSTVGHCVVDGKLIEIGSGRTYETMVFRIAGICKCGCGTPEIGEQLDDRGYNHPKDAHKGHLQMCFEYAKPKHQ